MNKNRDECKAAVAKIPVQREIVIDKEELYVCHIGHAILFLGTKDECETYRQNQPFLTDCWQINSVEEYGFDCYEKGHDAGSSEYRL